MLILPLAFSCSNKKEQTSPFIEGIIQGLGNNSIVLMDEQSFPIDTVLATDNHFKFEHDLDTTDPKRYGIFIPQLSNENGEAGMNRAYFFVDTKAITITGAIVDENLKDINVTGSPITKEYNEIDYNLPANVGLRLYTEPYNTAFKNYNQIDRSEENLKELKFYGQKVDSLFQLKALNIRDAISDHPESIALSNMVYWYYRSDSAETIEAIIEAFSPSIKDSYYIALLEEQLKLKQSASVGAIAPDLTLIDHQDNPVKLSDYRGNYLLLDFWASWCAPCIKEIPNLIQAHNDFESRGLKIVSISIDQSKTNWEKALKKEDLPYIKLFDDQRTVQQKYQIEAIPYIVLISPEGKILKINEGLRGGQLKKTLETYL